MLENYINKTLKFKKIMETQTKNVPKKERNVSASYTLKSFNAVIKKMEKAKMITPAETVTLKDINKKVMERWIGMELNGEQK